MAQRSPRVRNATQQCPLNLATSSAWHKDNWTRDFSREFVWKYTGFVKPLIVLLLTALACYGQSGAAPAKYDVASIKPNTDNDSRFAFRIEPGGSLSATGITLQRLMMSAFNVQNFRIVGGPDWLTTRRWDVQARPDRPAPLDQIRPMLRTLLETRFHLHSHSEIRQLPLFELSVDRRGSKVPPVKDPAAKPDVRLGPGSIQLTNNTAATFASQLSYSLNRPVVDRTNLSGKFDFALRWTPDPSETADQPAATPNGPSIFTAVSEQLGLRLKAERGPVEVIVVDDAQLPPAN